MPIYASRDKLRQELDDLGMSHLFAKSLGKSEKCRHVCAFCHHFVLLCSGDNTDGAGDVVCKFTILFCLVLVIILMVVVMMFADYVFLVVVVIKRSYQMVIILWW